ncbi:conserved hypothetical protein [Mesorhizobium prunaredense]|uniref:Uncharacterized protein n=1 Tax=Mesorhizobium prunaredense TaxID=1631249 RepID=A0A1R3VC63_9HYPH|nr:hypothetical protein [Mesorhizobium prunaredense]SIT57472.1 conserved hypothetical protein [Mesorhizobium prunaredense]
MSLLQAAQQMLVTGNNHSTTRVSCEGPLLLHGQRVLEGSQMPRRRFNRTYLSPHDLAICERVFDQVCAYEHIDPFSRDAEVLAVTIVAIFRAVTTNERELLEEVRSRRRSKSTDTAH